MLAVPMAIWSPLLAVTAAGAAALLGRWRPAAAPPLSISASTAVLAAVLFGWPTEGTGAVELPWVPTWGWWLHLAADGLARVYCLLAAGVALAVLAFAWRYVPHAIERHGEGAGALGRFHAWMLLFLGSMLTLALAQDLIVLLVAFDVTAVCSYVLIAFHRGEAEARDAARTALLVTGVPSVAFLAGALALGAARSTFQIPELLAGDPAGGGEAVAVALILVAALAKSAQVPFQLWLPRAMVAPTPVSAYLHAAAMVAAGVFVIHRLHPLLGAEARAALLVAGGLSVVLGALRALGARGLKEILAWSTVSQYGYAVVLLGFGGAGAAAAAGALVLVHGAAKSALFLTAGAVTLATGEDALPAVGGLGRRMPLLATGSAVAAAALAGLPLTAGYFKDEGFFAEAARHALWVQGAAVAAVALTVAYAWRFWSGIFLGRAPAGAPGEVRPPGRLAVWPVAALAALLVAGGLAPGALQALGRGSAAAVHGTDGGLELAYHLELRPSVLMALGAWALGALLAVAVARGAVRTRRASALTANLFDRAWEGSLAALDRLSDRLHRAELRDLRDRIASVLLPAGALVLAGLLLPTADTAFRAGPDVAGEWTLIFTLALAAGAALAAVLVRGALGLVLLLTIVGYAVAAGFAVLGGPDVALIVVLVEVAVTVLFVAALVRIREIQQPERPGLRHHGRWHVVAGIATGTLAFAVCWAGLSSPAEETVAVEAVRTSPLAHADNAVAAVLADFRGLDTLGEVTVLLAASLGVSSLLRLGKRGR